jgi:hypothetical protein
MPRKSNGRISAPINDQGGLLISPLVYGLQVELAHLLGKIFIFFEQIFSGKQRWGTSEQLRKLLRFIAFNLFKRGDDFSMGTKI